MRVGLFAGLTGPSVGTGFFLVQRQQTSSTHTPYTDNTRHFLAKEVSKAVCEFGHAGFPVLTFLKIRKFWADSSTHISY